MVNRLKQRLVLSIASIFIVILVITMSVLYVIMEKSFYNSAKISAFSITNSIYIAMNEVIFDGVDIASFISKDPLIHHTFFNDQASELTYQEDLSTYLQNVSTIYNYQKIYLVSFNTDRCYGSNGFTQDFNEDNNNDAWFFNKKMSSLSSSTDNPYESLLINNPEGDTDFYMTYIISDENANALGLLMLGIDYNLAIASNNEQASRLSTDIYLVNPDGSYQDALLSNGINGHTIFESLSIDTLDKSGDFNFVTKDKTYIAYRYIEEMNRFIIITQLLSINMFSTFALTFLVVALILLIIVLVVLRFYTTSSHKIMHHASIDALTGVMNRSSYNSKILDAVELCSKYHISSTLIFIDIDHFKSINDSLGHDKGDEIIIALANLLKNTKRKDDHLFRWGGDEFAIIARCALEDALGLSRRILESSHQITYQTVQQTVQQSVHGHNNALTLSIGVSELLPTDNKKDCFNRADQALYHAKEQGRDQICYI
ncbi:MAG: GGDEF domain-containing protein [Vallitaleaceae bacterium]|jgi:diguanylate cyclase (GGDEF)-like protein|nr:GGDEF domain-containing protein [Vallitaleaceae bacterium]